MLSTSVSDRARSATTALLVGTTGLVGRHCLSLLAQDPAVARVCALVRRPTALADLLDPAACARAHTAKVELPVVNFEQLARHSEHFRADLVFCALGTTIRQAGSQAAFRQVDFDYPLQVARLAKAQGARHFLLISALGADAGSRFFYNRVKGELEDALRGLAFESLTLARPSVLLGQRNEPRLGEWVAGRAGWLMPERYKPVAGSQVAQALITAAHHGRPGVQVLENIALRRGNAPQMG